MIQKHFAVAGSRKLSELAASGLSAHVTPMHVLAAAKRLPTERLTLSRTIPLDRWKANFQRLSTQRMIELAIAAAALQSSKTRMEQAIEGTLAKPSNWEDWERKDWTDELLQSLGDNGIVRAWSALSRMVSLSCLAAPLVVLYPLQWLGLDEKWSWSYALWGIEQAGPTFLKLAQWATTRHDLFSPKFCQYFGKLRDDTSGHSWEQTLKILEESLGEAASSIQLEKKPIGSGCIAQVYRGKLTSASDMFPKGAEVAVKVQHPGIWHKVCVDFYIMGKAARFLESLPLLNLKFLSLVDSVQQFRDIMLPQLDLSLEARNLDRFNQDFSGDKQVSFPRPLHGLTTNKVLTESFLHGRPIMDFAADADEKTRKDLAFLGLETSLKMIFLNDFLHGDLHPGNILASRDPKTGELRMHLLDCGIVVEMGPEQHVHVVKILGAFVRGDGRKAGKLMVDANNLHQASDEDVEHFVAGIQGIVEADRDSNFVEKVGEYIIDICYMACVRKVKLEASFVNAALAVEIMEGIASALHPSMTVAPVALPLIVRAEMMHNLPKFQFW